MAWFHCYKMSTIGKSIEKESRLVVARVGGRLEFDVRGFTWE